MAEFQVSTIVLESVCDLAVLFDQHAPSQFESQMVLAKDRQRRRYGGEGKPLSPQQILSSCPDLLRHTHG